MLINADKKRAEKDQKKIRKRSEKLDNHLVTNIISHNEYIPSFFEQHKKQVEEWPKKIRNLGKMSKEEGSSVFDNNK